MSTDNIIDKILEERGNEYGDFRYQGNLSQTLKNTLIQHYVATHGNAEAKPLPPFVIEAMAMICHKLARIANGNPYNLDSWQDIAGYAQLVVNGLVTTAQEAKPDNNNDDNAETVEVVE